MNNKKKILVTILIILLIFSVIVCFFIKKHYSMKAVVIKSYNNSVSVMNIKNGKVYDIGLSKDTSLHFKQDQEIMVYFKVGTMINDSNPASINNKYIKKIKILKEKSDIRYTK